MDYLTLWNNSKEELKEYYNQIIGGEILFVFNGDDISDFIKEELYELTMNFCKSKLSQMHIEIDTEIKRVKITSKFLDEYKTKHIRYMSNIMRNFITHHKIIMLKNKDFTAKLLKPYYREKKLKMILD